MKRRTVAHVDRRTFSTGMAAALAAIGSPALISCTPTDGERPYVDSWTVRAYAPQQIIMERERILSAFDAIEDLSPRQRENLAAVIVETSDEDLEELDALIADYEGRSV